MITLISKINVFFFNATELQNFFINFVYSRKKTAKMEFQALGTLCICLDRDAFHLVTATDL